MTEWCKTSTCYIIQWKKNVNGLVSAKHGRTLTISSVATMLRAVLKSFVPWQQFFAVKYCVITDSTLEHPDLWVYSTTPRQQFPHIQQYKKQSGVSVEGKCLLLSVLPGNTLLLFALASFLCAPLALHFLCLPLAHPRRVLSIFIQQSFLAALAVHVHLHI